MFNQQNNFQFRDIIQQIRNKAYIIIMDKFSQSLYKSKGSSLSPLFLRNLKQKRSVKSITKLNDGQSSCNLTQQFPQQHKMPKQMAANPTSNYYSIYQANKKSFSCDQITGAQCKVFQNKVKIKKCDKRGSVVVLHQQIQNSQNISNFLNYRQDQNNTTGLNFAEQYRLNLRRTVFNQTKLMMKSKKNKQKQSLQTLNAPKMHRQQQIRQISKVEANKHSLHAFRHKNSSKRTIDSDTMYKTLIKREGSLPVNIVSSQLDISKFPIIMRSKQELASNSNPTVNYSNLLMALNMRENAQKMGEPMLAKKQTKKATNKIGNRNSFIQKHQIKPWETFADQFFD